MSEAHSCTATFTLETAASTFTLTVTKLGNGEGTVASSPSGISCGNDCSEAYNSGASVSLTADPASGSTFAGWSGDPDCSDGMVTMSADRSCTASFAAAPSVLGVPDLLAPINNASIVQNNPSIGCSLDPAAGYGHEIVFDWTDIAAAVEYDLFVKHRGSPLPLIDSQVSDSDHTDTRCQAFVTDSNLADWDWRVRARDAQGNTGNWSQTATFRFEPCRLAGGASCGSAPPALADLVVGPFTAMPANPVLGEQVTLEAEVQNEGAGAAAASVVNIVGGFDPQGATVLTNVPSLAPGESFTAQRIVTPPGALVYLITATADFSDTVVESDENNNERQLFLTVTSPTPPGVYVAGSSDVTVSAPSCVFFDEEISTVMARQVQITIAPNGDVMATVAGGALSGTGVLSGNSFSFSISTPAPFSTTNISGCTGSGTISGTLVGTTITGTWSASGTCATTCAAWAITLNQNYVATSAP